MVGVPKSTGCKICRTRKIKCDETWPFCLNCRKNGKECPGRPDRHTFRDVRAGQSRSPVWPSDPSVAGPVIEYESRTLKPLDERIRSNGSATHRFRITGPGGLTRPRKPGGRSKSSSSSPPKSPFLTQPSPSPQFQLARALVTATTTGSPGQRMSVFGPFIEEVPARIGHNAALDAAVAVLVNAHTSLVHKKMANEIVSPQLYLKAIMALQTSLEDPRQGRSANTLCATVLLGLVEALAGPRTGNRYLAHVGGAGRLMELQGPGQYHDKFAKEILRFSRGGIIITAIYERRKCFLSLPDWKDIAFDKTGLGFDDCLNTDLIQHMSELPGILKDLKELTNQYTYQPLDNVCNFSLDPNIDDGHSDRCPSLDFSPASFDDHDLFTDLHTIPPSVPPYPVSAAMYPHSPARLAVLKKIVSLRESLTALGVHMKARLGNRNTVVELPAIEPNSPVPTAYHFTTWRDITSYSCFWSMVIMTNKVMMKLLPPYDPLNFELQAECRATALEICKTWEDAWATKPIGSFHTGLSFVVAYEFCVPEVQEWIIRSLNSLLDYQMVDAFRWSHEIIEMMSGKLTGEGPDLVFSTMNMSKEVV